MIRFLLPLVASLSLAAAPEARAMTYPVDDSASQVLASSVGLRWDSAMPANRGPQTMSGSVTVNVRLDVRRWKGQQVRIYQVLPPLPASPVLVSWTSQGRLMPGQMRDGERALVYAGRIDLDELQDVFHLNITADGRRIEGRESLRFGFEIELEGA